MKYPKIYYVMIIIGFSLITGGGLSRSFLPLLSRELDPSGLLVGFAISSYHSSGLSWKYLQDSYLIE